VKAPDAKAPEPKRRDEEPGEDTDPRHPKQGPNHREARREGDCSATQIPERADEVDELLELSVWRAQLVGLLIVWFWTCGRVGR